MKDIFDVEIKVGDVIAFVRKYNRYFDLQKGKVVKLLKRWFSLNIMMNTTKLLKLSRLFIINV